MVISGKDKGKQGTIMKVMPLDGKVVIDGVAMVKRHIRARLAGQSSGIIERPRPIDASNVMFMDPKDKKPTRIGRKVVDGKLVRFAKKSNTTLS
jgi:large subunit ribosomal protein L24